MYSSYAFEGNDKSFRLQRYTFLQHICNFIHFLIVYNRN